VLLKGKSSLPLLQAPSHLLQTLLNSVDDRSRIFLHNIRIYNNMLSFTSIGGTIDTSMNNGSPSPQFILNGQNYHCIGSLLPQDGSKPKFAQLYIYDTENEISNTMKHLRLINICFIMLYEVFKFVYLVLFLYMCFGSNSNQSLVDQSLVVNLIKTIDDRSTFAKSFRRVRDLSIDKFKSDFYTETI